MEPSGLRKATSSRLPCLKELEFDAIGSGCYKFAGVPERHVVHGRGGRSGETTVSATVTTPRQVLQPPL